MIIQLKKSLNDSGYILSNNVYKKPENNDKYSSNFSKQWRDFSKTQVDEFNGTNISKNLLKGVIFNEFKNIYDKNVLEIGCGSGRFSEHLSKYANLLVLNDMSEAIYYNHYITKSNVVAIKSDFTILKNLNIKYDVVICRGVLQHTPNPYKSILNLYELCSPGGIIYFDIYKKPKFKIINPKYIWRYFLKFFITYDILYKFLTKNINKFLSVRRKLNKLFKINLNYVWDYFFPIYDYKDKLPLNENQLKEWAILDTLDGLITKFDTPLSYKEVHNFLNTKNIKIEKYDDKFSSYKIIK